MRSKPLHRCLFASSLALALLLSASPVQAATAISISVNTAPLPVYEQPLCPGPGYVWTPGYWAWNGGDYYWVAGGWMPAPVVRLWTSGYWS